MGRAGARLKCNELTDAVLYTMLQPCGMCTMASIWAKIGRIVYGAGRDDVHEMYTPTPWGPEEAPCESVLPRL